MLMFAERLALTRLFFLGSMLAVVSVPAVCGTLVERDSKLAAAGIPDPPAAQKTPRSSSRTGPVLRCWQYGRLILEESGVGLPAAAKGAQSLAFPRQGSGRESVYVFDLTQGMCTLTGAGPGAEGAAN